MNAYFVITAIGITLGSTIALWWRVYSLDRTQGLVSLIVPLLLLFAILRWKQTKTYLSVCIVSYIALGVIISMA